MRCYIMNSYKKISIYKKSNMDNDINKKTSPNQMRILMQRMRTGKFIAESNNVAKKDLTVRDMLKITRNLNEDVEENDVENTNQKTIYDQKREEDKFRNFFNDMNVDIKFIDLEISDDLIFWGGTIDGVVQFVYKVTPDESTSGVNFKYLPEFNHDNPDNDMLTKKIESYYDSFYQYWRNNMLQK